jgi:hypothetical protein
MHFWQAINHVLCKLIAREATSKGCQYLWQAMHVVRAQSARGKCHL